MAQYVKRAQSSSFREIWNLDLIKAVTAVIN